MKKNFITASLVFVLSIAMLLSSFAPTFAETPNTTDTNAPETTVKTEVDTTVETEADTSIETEADTIVETQVDTTVDTEADISVETEADISVETEADISVETKADISVETEADTSKHIHTYEYAKNDASHYFACIECGFIASSGEHIFAIATSEKAHYTACTECGYIAETCEHTFVAKESYHQWDCDECGRNRVYHNTDNMVVCEKNAFFHEWTCECGYSYSETHNFGTAYTTDGHYEVCLDCGYTTELVAHVMTDDLWSSYHDVWCEYCGYTAEHHVGVNYTCLNATTCQATCSCGIVAEIPHDWDGFVCDGCGYIMSGDTYAVVSRISKNDEGYRVRFIDNCGTHRIDMWDVAGCEEGDFVKINHHGNDIFDITVIVDGDIVNDAENFSDYILSDRINEKSQDLVFEDLVIEEFEYHENVLDITFESGRSTGFCNFSEFIVYDLMDEGIGELEEDFAYLTMYVGDTAYFICFW